MTSPRVEFQWKYFAMTPRAPEGQVPNTLNVGCADDPIGLGEGAMHYDIDDWSYLHRYFEQGDAHKLPFNDKTFLCVIMGDILEHVVDPFVAVQEAMRVTAVGGLLVLTVFEEWRLPGPGQWIEEAHEIAEKENVERGYEGREDYQKKNYPERVGVPDEDDKSHLCHINQFEDSDMVDMVNWVVSTGEFTVIENVKVVEENFDGHDWYNWLICFRRMR
jgi:SAM-dependent methyltransferase